MPSFGEILRHLREQADISQEDLGKAVKCAKSTISQYELNKRNPDLNTLTAIADYFDISVDYLLGRTDKKSFSESNNVSTTPKDVRPDIANDDLSRAQIAANMEGRYGEKPSPELVELIREVVRDEIQKDKK